jgi:dTMP kinase
MDRFENEDMPFHRKIEKAYLKLSKEDPKRFIVVDGSIGIEDVHRIIREKVEQLLENHGI